MSNLSGSVDLVREREQERQARQQLLDVFRDPSPQPIFGQPIKVELEDETSRRIKDTLGDFNQVQHVLINDPKHLIGISRSGAVAGANNASSASATAASSRSSATVDHGGGGPTTWSSRNYGTSNGISRSGGNVSNGHHGVSKRPHPINGLHKPPAGLNSSLTGRRPHPTSAVKSGASVDKKQQQQGPPKHRSDHPPKINPISRGYSSSVGHQDQPQPPSDSGTRASNPDRPPRIPSSSTYHPPLPGGSVNADKEHEHGSNHRHRRTTSSNNSGAAGANGESKPVLSQNGSSSSTSLPNGVVKHHRSQRIPDPATKKFQVISSGKHPPLPPKLSIPAQEERSSVIEVEVILREMKQAVPPPLTGIQTPRTEESGFTFPSEASEKDFSRVLEHLGHNAAPSTPPSVHEHSRAAKKSPHAANSPFNLQEDLEMSDSDDDGNMVPACKNPQISEVNPYTKCPPSLSHDESNGARGDVANGCTPAEAKKAAAPSSTSANGSGDPALSVQSSSSESSDSDSEDSCSESNDSDSSASSEASERETSGKPTQRWGLSNFFDETRRNHSPFMAPDTNTNSSGNAVKEEQPRASANPPDKDRFSLADEDSVNCILNKFPDNDIKAYWESPINDMFNIDNGIVSVKSNVPSPLPASPVPAPPPPVPVRGPRTPPSPEPHEKEDSEEDDDPVVKGKSLKTESIKSATQRTEIRTEVKSETCSSPIRQSEHKPHRSRNEQFLNSRSQKRSGSSSRTKELISPAAPSVDANQKSDIQFHTDTHSSASNSRDLSKATLINDSKNSSSTHLTSATSSCPVPSVTSAAPKSTHRSPVKSHHNKHSTSSAAPPSSFSSPTKKRIPHETKEGSKNERISSKSKSSKSKQSSEREELARSRSSSLNKSEKDSVSLIESTSSKIDKTLDAKTKHSTSYSKTPKNSSHKTAGIASSPSKSFTSKKTKSSSGKNSLHHDGGEKKKSERKKKTSKFSIKNFLQSPAPAPFEALDTRDVSPIHVSGPEDFSPSPVRRKSIESSPFVDKSQKDDSDENDKDPIRPMPDRNSGVVTKRKTHKLRKSSTSSSSRSRSRSNSRTQLPSTEKTKLKKKTPKGVKRRASRSSNSDISGSLKKRPHRDAKPTRQNLQKTSLSSSRSISPHGSSHRSPGSLGLGLDFPCQPPELLSPISSSEKTDSAIVFTPPSPLPNVVMVSIPFSKLLRIPEKHHHSSPPTLKPPKDRPEETGFQVTLAVSSPSLSSACAVAVPTPSSSERRSSSSVSPCKKDIKTKHRTEPSKSSKTSSSGNKSGEKAATDLSNSQSEVPLPSKNDDTDAVILSSDKISIKNVTDAGSKSTKTGHNSQNTNIKKRKMEEVVPEIKKKPKTPSSSSKSSPAVEADSKEKVVVMKTEKLDVTSGLDKRLTPKALERCDSASSLSSLCSQMSHKSSKSVKERSKDSTKDSQETKKAKSTTPVVKEVKREKEDRPKIVVKKEPGCVVKTEKTKSKSKERSFIKSSLTAENKKVPEPSRGEGHSASSQVNCRENSCKIEETKPQPTNHQRLLPNSDQDPGSDWELFAPEVQQELRGIPNHLNKVSSPVPWEYYWQEGKKLKHMAEKEKNPILQALKYFEASVMFILTSLNRELTNKDPDSIYQMYRETLKFTNVIRSVIQKRLSHYGPGNIDFKILILCLKCQSLLHLKLYNLKIKEVKEQHKGVSDFMHSSSSKLGSHCSPLSSSSSHSRNMSQPSPCQPRLTGGGGGAGSVPSPHSPTPSPAGSVASVGSQSSGYSSSEVNGNHSIPHSKSLLQLPQHVPQFGAVSVPQNMFDVMAKHHSHLSNLHMCHELWEQADMYMTRSNSKDFFKEIAEKSVKVLSLHSSIKDLVSYLQRGLSLLRSSYC